MKRLTFSAGVTLKAAAAGKPRRFEILAYTGGTLRVEGFPLPVVVDLQGLEASRGAAIVLAHELSDDATVGQTDSIDNDGRRLLLAGPVTGEHQPRVQRAILQAEAGQQWQASIGGICRDIEEIAAGQSVRVNGQTFNGPVLVARQFELRETSILPVGADRSTEVNLAAAAALMRANAMTFEEWLQSMGLDAATMNEAALAIFRKEYDATHGATVATAEPVAAGAALNLRASRAGEYQRIGQIESIAHGHPLIAAAAIRNGWGVERTELEVLKANQRSRAPSGLRHGGGDGAATPQVLEASLLLRGGREALAVKAYGERTVEAARKARITNLVDLAGKSLQAAGLDPDAYGNRDAMLKAAFSTNNLPNILSNVINRELVEAYQETTNDWRKFCHVASAPDFRERTGIRPAAVDGLLLLPKGGQIKDTSLGEEALYQWKVDTYTRMLDIDRQDIVNDDLGFLNEVSPIMGAAAGRTLLDLIYQTIMGGQAAGFFASGKNNLGEAGSALDVTSLGTGVSSMRSQRDSKGNDLNIRPVALVVGPSLELTARALLNSVELIGLADELMPSGNPVSGIVPNLIVEPRLENTDRFTGASATQWFLFGAPKDRPVTVGFLNGQQSPMVQTEEADFNKLGLQMRCVFDFGVALTDHWAAYKATGAAGGGG